MKRNILREKLNNDEPTLSTHIHTTWPSVVEALGHTGKYDYSVAVAGHSHMHYGRGGGGGWQGREPRGGLW